MRKRVSREHHFSVDPDRVVHETIDGETIIIQLKTGTYYSLTGPGAEIWAMLAAGSSTEEVADQLQRRYEARRDEFAGAIAELVGELRQEELLQDDPGAAEPGGPIETAPIDDSNGARAPFDPPTLKKYTDMQYFLLLDPIHEVDGMGWPNLPSEQAGR